MDEWIAIVNECVIEWNDLCVILSYLVLYRFNLMNSLVERLVVSYSEEVPSSDTKPTKTFMDTCVLLVKNICKEVWPCLAVVGGVNPGFQLGGECFNKTEKKKGVIVTVPEGRKVNVQEMYDDGGTTKIEQM